MGGGKNWETGIDIYITIDTYTQSVSQSVKVAQSCLTLCDPMDYIVLGIL